MRLRNGQPAAVLMITAVQTALQQVSAKTACPLLFAVLAMPLGCLSLPAGHWTPAVAWCSAAMVAQQARYQALNRINSHTMMMQQQQLHSRRVQKQLLLLLTPSLGWVPR
jgi:hypothetical protein